jgi:hypothetical protein
VKLAELSGIMKGMCEKEGNVNKLETNSKNENIRN